MDPKPVCKLLSPLPDYSGVEEFLDMLCRTTEQVDDVELSYSGYVGFGVM